MNFTLTLALILMAIPAISEARSTFKPIKMLCGATDDSAKNFVVIDFETKTVSKDLGQVGESLPSTYSVNDYPFRNYRLISNGKERFRIANHIMRTPYKLGQHIAYLSIYEEDPDGKTLHRRIAQAVDTTVFKTAYRLRYNVPNSKRAVNCFVN